MQNNNNIILTLSIVFILLTITTFLFAGKSNSESASSGNAVTEVDAKYVCMVTDKLFQKEQIPVVVADKTYYGCCEMCKAKLKDSPQKRFSKDPVSGKSVDKASSVIGATPGGNVYYFENKDNLNKFAEK